MTNFKIQKLKISNFRNLEDTVISFNSGINCIFGQNGNGKTNILEAIYIIANKKSFRKNSTFPQYLSINGEKPEIIFSSVFHNQNKELVSYSIRQNIQEMVYSLNGQIIKKKLDIKTVFINPFDSYSFHNDASERREFFDHYLSLLDSDYKNDLKKYKQSLKFKNILLAKKPSLFLEQIKAIDPEISQYAYKLNQRRILFLQELEKFFEENFKNIFSEEHSLKLKLESKINGMNAIQIQEALKNNLSKDLERGTSTLGPHRDDYLLLFDSINSYDFCSLGQQKMAYLSLLFAYIDVFRYKYMSYPIVLIDDVSGELDQNRWRRLVDYLEKRDFQVLITTANEKFKEELDRIQGANKIYVDNGSIKNC